MACAASRRTWQDPAAAWPRTRQSAGPVPLDDFRSREVSPRAGEMLMRNGVARRQSVARRGLETARRAQVDGGAGFLCLRALAADLRGVAGLMAIGLPAGPLAASRGSGPL